MSVTNTKDGNKVVSGQRPRAFNIAGMAMNHLLALIGATVSIAGLVSLITSKSVKIWVRAHSYTVFIILIIALVASFVIVDLMLNRERRQGTAHDRSIISKILHTIPPDGSLVIWLKEGFLAHTIPIKYTETLDAVASGMNLNVVGLDNSKANSAYLALRDAINKFLKITADNLWSNTDYTAAEKSPAWPYEQWKVASDQILEARETLVKAYDEFLQVCHRNRLD